MSSAGLDRGTRPRRVCRTEGHISEPYTKTGFPSLVALCVAVLGVGWATPVAGSTMLNAQLTSSYLSSNLVLAQPVGTLLPETRL